MEAGNIPPAEIGSAAHVEATAGQVRRALGQAGITPDSCGLVLIRAPTDPSRPGQDGAARAAAALGATLALKRDCRSAAHLLADPVAHASCCFVVARHDAAPQQVLVMGAARGGDPGFAIASGTLRDPIDSPGVAAILTTFGMRAAPQLPPAESARVIAVLSKGDAPPDGMIRGLPHVMYADNDVAMHRHARAAYGTLLSSAIGHTACLVSGGAERQGPPGGGFASIIVATGRG
jgi:cyanuric acid amidohydrolase